MTLIKLGESFNITQEDIKPANIILADPDIVERFNKFATGLKTIAPMAKDFLYFTAVMMHAAEASLLDEEGNLKKDASNKPLEANWEKLQNGGVRWVCSDSNILPYKNSNSDIFPEEELIKAHKKWIGRPLCLDHKSSSVDSIRGVIVDTYYDHKHKRVIALCALDKVNYPDLARKVATGYATSVSMGTAVGKAVCSDCHRVARVESDFCDHMRNKSCYGEINLDLSPIELSIVVNGADPLAKIKHIIASDLTKAAEHIADYKKKVSEGNVDKEELNAIQKDIHNLSERVNKLVEAMKLNDLNDTNYGTTRSTKEMHPPIETNTATPPFTGPEPRALWNSEKNDLIHKLSHLQEDFNKLKMVINKEEPTMSNEKKAYYQGTEEPTPGRPRYEKEDYETIRDTQDKQMVGQNPFPEVGPVDGMHPGYESFGETEEARKRRLQRLAEVKERQLRREAVLEKAKENLNKGKEAYFHGGGDVNEPKSMDDARKSEPGSHNLRYPNEVDYRQIRDEQDKQMVGQKPFPDVGPVDGIHPGYQSYKETPWGNTEQDRKRNLGRYAALKAKFIKASSPDGNADLGNSRWDVYADDKLILSAKVDEITGGNTTDVLYGSIATKSFGENLLNKIRVDGFDAAKSALVKSAQPAQMMGAPGQPAAGAPPSAPMPKEEDVAMDVPEGGGAPSDQVQELVSDLQDALKSVTDRANDLEEAVKAMEGEVPELEDVPPAAESAFAEGKVASVESMQGMRKTLNGMLRKSMKEASDQLRAHAEELKLTASIYDTKLANLTAEQRKYLSTLATDAVNDAKSTLTDSLKLMGAYVKYAHGTESLLKRANAEKDLKKQADGEDMPGSMNEQDYSRGDYDYDYTQRQAQSQEVKPGEVEQSAEPSYDENKVDLFPGAAPGEGTGAGAREALPTRRQHPPEYNPQKVPGAGYSEPESAKPKGDETYEYEENYADDKREGFDMVELVESLPAPETWEAKPEAGKEKYDVEQMFTPELTETHLQTSSADDGITVTLPGGAEVKTDKVEGLPPGTQIPAQTTAGFDLSTKEGRAAYRTKFAQKGVQYSDMLQKAHPKGGHTPGMMDTKPEGDLMHVEDLVEQKEKHMAVVNMSPKARKQAAQIAKLVSEGKLNPEQIPSLVAEGVDPDAAKYWKQMWQEAGDPESKEFANKLVQEHGKQKVAEEIEKREVKIKRAYDLAYMMRDKGLIEETQLKDQVEEILKWNDDAFESTKRIIAKQASMRKQAVPQVGLLNSGDVILPASEKTENQENLTTAFNNYFAGRRF